MASKFCTRTLKILSDLVQFHSAFMLACYCIFNLVFSVAAVRGNLLVIYALWKSSSIPTTVKKLFLSLALSDLAVGMLPQLMWGIIIAVMLSKTSNGDSNFASFCPVIVTACYFFAFFLCSASFFTIAAIAVDRLLAISLHLRYHELVTSKRINMVLIMLWLTSGVTASISILFPVANKIIATFQVILLLLTTVGYIRIYKVVRYHRIQIQSQLQLQNFEVEDLHRQKKSAWNALIVYVTFLFCYLPFYVSVLFVLIYGEKTSPLIANYATLLLIFLNSSLNPLVYCWRYREIRNIVRSSLKKVIHVIT